MTDRKIVKFGCALALATTPFSVSAYSADSAMNACAAALTARMSDASGTATAYSLDETSLDGGRLGELSIFYLDARDPKTQEVVARANCVVDSRARVKRITTLPLDAALYQAELDRRLEHSKLRQKANIDANVDMSQSYR